jgi:hypothetical protein
MAANAKEQPPNDVEPGGAIQDRLAVSVKWVVGATSIRRRTRSGMLG